GPSRGANFHLPAQTERCADIAAPATSVSATLHRGGALGGERRREQSSRQCWFHCCRRPSHADTPDLFLCFPPTRPCLKRLPRPKASCPRRSYVRLQLASHRGCAGLVPEPSRDRAEHRLRFAVRRTMHVQSTQCRWRTEPG